MSNSPINLVRTLWASIVAITANLYNEQGLPSNPRTQLAREKGAEKSNMFFRRLLCWLRWNAALRSMANSLSAVYWMPGGVNERSIFNLPTNVIDAAHRYQKLEPLEYPL